MAKRLILAGGGGFCRELYFWSADCIAAGTLPPLAGYLDDTGDGLARRGYDMPWLGTVADFVPTADDAILLAVGSAQGKRAIHGKLSARGGTFPRLIHPTTRIVGTARIGEGAIMCPQTAAGPDTRIDRFVTFNSNSGIGHDGSVGEFSSISSLVDITGFVRIGSDVMVGSGATFVPKVRIGDGATIGAGCVIYRSVPAGATMYAAPAKRLKSR